MMKVCDTCKHLRVDNSEEPCKTCRGWEKGIAVYPFWELGEMPLVEPGYLDDKHLPAGHPDARVTAESDPMLQAYEGLFDEVEELFRGEVDMHPDESLYPLWQKYQACLEAAEQ